MRAPSLPLALAFGAGLLVLVALGWPRETQAPEPSAPPPATNSPLEPAAPSLDRAADEERAAGEEVHDAWNPWPSAAAAPGDPRETGASHLILRLTAEEAGGPLAGKVDLWRIDEPGNEHWSRGDRKIGTETLDEGQVAWAGLAPGRYRIHAHGQRTNSLDPAGFAVHGGKTNVAFTVADPRRLPVRVKVFDPQAKLLTRALVMFGGGGISSRSPASPPWVRRRYLRRGVRSGGRSGGSGCGCCGPSSEGKFVTGDDRGILVASTLEPSRYRSFDSTFWVTAEGFSAVRVFFAPKSATPLAFVAAAMPMEAIYDMLRLPDGSRAIDAGATITAVCRAVAVPEDGDARSWDRLTIEVNVDLAGYRPRRLDFSHRMRRRIFTLKPNPR